MSAKTTMWARCLLFLPSLRDWYWNLKVYCLYMQHIPRVWSFTPPPFSTHFLPCSLLPLLQGLVDVAEHRDVLLAGAAVEVETSVEEPGSPVKHKRWDQVSQYYRYIHVDVHVPLFIFIWETCGWHSLVVNPSYEYHKHQGCTRVQCVTCARVCKI